MSAACNFDKLLAFTTREKGRLKSPQTTKLAARFYIGGSS
jgi:hypothetical protein